MNNDLFTRRQLVLLQRMINRSINQYLLLNRYPLKLPQVSGSGGSGDMLKSVYDPGDINDDAFSMDNMSEGTGTNKIFTAAERTKLAGIEDGAEVNVNADWNATSGDAMILNKPTIPTALSQLSDDSTHRLVTDTEKGIWNSKQNANNARYIRLIDHFIMNGAASHYGDLAYSLSGFSAPVTQSDVEGPGVIRLTSNTSAGSYNYLALPSRTFKLNEIESIKIMLYFQNYTDKQAIWEFGLLYGLGSYTNIEGASFYWSQADGKTTWWARSNNGTNTTEVDTEVDVATSAWQTLEIRYDPNATAVLFYIDDGLVATINSDLTANYVYPTVIRSRVPSGGSGYYGRYVYIDYWELICNKDLS